MEVKYKPLAIKHLKKIHLNDKKKVKKKIESLAKYPLAGKPLLGEFKGLRCLRAWPLRIIYTYNQKASTIVIEDVDYRGGIYK